MSEFHKPMEKNSALFGASTECYGLAIGIMVCLALILYVCIEVSLLRYFVAPRILFAICCSRFWFWDFGPCYITWIIF